jgi:hypothetical protein
MGQGIKKAVVEDRPTRGHQMTPDYITLSAVPPNKLASPVK